MQKIYRTLIPVNRLRMRMNPNRVLNVSFFITFHVTFLIASKKFYLIIEVEQKKISIFIYRLVYLFTGFSLFIVVGEDKTLVT